MKSQGVSARRDPDRHRHRHGRHRHRALCLDVSRRLSAADPRVHPCARAIHRRPGNGHSRSPSPACAARSRLPPHSPCRSRCRAERPFPYRDLILFVAFGVIFITLIGVGLLCRRWCAGSGLRMPAATSTSPSTEAEITARRQALDAALKSLDTMTAENNLSEDVVSLLRAAARRPHQPASGITRSRSATTSPPPALPLTRELISAERKFIHVLLRDGQITDETRRRIERDLDLEEAEPCEPGVQGRAAVGRAIQARICYNRRMTRQALELLLERVSASARRGPEELLRVVTDIENKHLGVYRLSDDERDAVAPRSQGYARRKIVPAMMPVASVFNRYRAMKIRWSRARSPDIEGIFSYIHERNRSYRRGRGRAHRSSCRASPGFPRGRASHR